MAVVVGNEFPTDVNRVIPMNYIQCAFALQDPQLKETSIEDQAVGRKELCERRAYSSLPRTGKVVYRIGGIMRYAAARYA